MTTPRFRIDDVLQSKIFSPAQKQSIDMKPYFEWFKMATEPFEDKYLKLAVVAEGIESQPEWVQYIKDHPQWEIQCHGWEHSVMNHWEEDEIYNDLLTAKELLEKVFKQQITQFYPPKHYFSDHMFRACSKLKLSLMIDRVPVEDWFDNQDVPEVYFHFWNPQQIVQAKRILEMCGESEVNESS